VFCEKPAATTFGEYRDQIDEDDRRPDQVTLVDYLLMFDPLERRLFSMVESALFGEIAQIQVNYRHPVNISGSKAWKLNRNQIGDAIGMGIVHSLFIMVHVMGLQNQRPARVHAVSQSARVRPFEVDPLWTITVEFDGGAVGVCQGNIDFGNGYDSYHNVSGTHGGFVFDAQLPASTRLRYWSEKKTRGQWIFPLDAADCESKGLADLSWPADMQMPDSGDVLHHQVASVDSYFLEHVQNRRKCALGFAATQDVGDVWWGAILSAYRDRPVDMPLDRGADAEIGRAMSGE
jgi:predicted dehydrogenase